LTTELELRSNNNTRIFKDLLEKTSSLTNNEIDIIRVIAELSRGFKDE
jgi:hypothetical protein